MRVTLYLDSRRFLSVLEQSSLVARIENDLMIGLLHSQTSSPRTVPLFATIDVERTIVLAAFMTPPWPLVLAASSVQPKALEALALYLHEHDIPVSGVNAPEQLADAFEKVWCRQHPCTSTVKMDMTLHQLQSVTPVRPCAGSCVQVDEMYRDLVVDWARAFQQDVAIGDDPESIEPHADSILKAGNVFLWLDREPVCMTFRERPTSQSISIGYVYTPPLKRRQGYASCLVAAVSSRSLAEGYRACTLFTDKRNPTTNHIYRMIGYRPVCEYRYYTF